MTPRAIWAAAVALACSDATAPAVPVPDATPGVTPEASVQESPREPARPAIAARAASATGDAADRVAASLERLRPAPELRRTLLQLTVALSSLETGEAERLLRQARRTLDHLVASGEASEVLPELDVISLALDAAERELAGEGSLAQ